MEMRHPGKISTSYRGKTRVRSLGVEKKLLGGLFLNVHFLLKKKKK